MNKKGFIATSLLYSFFLVLCAILIAFVGLLVHNTALINKQINMIEEDLHRNLTLNDANKGEYFRLNICSKSVFFSPDDKMNYFLVSNDGNNVRLLASSVSYKFNNIELLDDLLSDITLKGKSPEETISESMSKKDYNFIKEFSNKEYINLESTSENSAPKIKILVKDKDDNDNVYKYYTTNETDENNETNPLNSVTSLAQEAEIYLRLAFNLDKNIKIITGDGTKANPYILEGGAAPCNKE